LPLAIQAQNKYKAEVPESVSKSPQLKSSVTSDKNNGVVGMKIRPSVKPRRYDTAVTIVGYTYYDLQTNNSVPRRLVRHPNGNFSLVWTSSQNTDKAFPDRGSAYSYYNGTSWSAYNINRLETERAGWPNIVDVTTGGTTKEYLVSHYASGDGILSGGQYWLSNSAIGQSNFSVLFEKDKPRGPLWIRTAATGKYIHAIGCYTDSRVIRSIRTPMVYYRYDVTTQKFVDDAVLLPGYDSSRVGGGTADNYSIDARGATVAIVVGGIANDLMLFKSNDSGKTWKKTIVDSFQYAPYFPNVDAAFDTTLSSDGTASVMLDANNVAHVFYSPQRLLNEIEGDSSYSIFFDNIGGIVHWDEVEKTKITLGGVIDYDNDRTISIDRNNSVNTGAGYGGSNLCTFPMGAVDAQGNLYAIYSAPHEIDANPDQLKYRHVYVCASIDGGSTWSSPQDLTPTEGLENVFASVVRDADNNLYMSWMRDELPGIYLVNNSQELQRNQILFDKFPVTDILQNRIGLYNASVGKVANNLFNINELYPNPAENIAYVNVNFAKPTLATVRVLDLTGKAIQTVGNSQMLSGDYSFKLDLANVPSGVYMVEVNAGNMTATKRLVVTK